MSVLYDEAQAAIAEEARRVVSAVSAKERLLHLLEAQGEYDDAVWRMAREQGWTGVVIPESYGGLGLGLLELGAIALALGAGAIGAPFVTTSFGAADALLRSGPESLRERWLPRLASGEAIGAVAFAEVGSTLPAKPALTFADGRVTGVKPAVRAGLRADLFIVLAQAGGELVLAAVGVGDAVERRALQTFDNSRCVANVRFRGAPAVELARGRDARDTALDVLARQAIVTAHEQTGGAEALMTTARDYALQRKAFGQVIGAFQSVKHRIAELYALVELARANAIHAASVAEGGELVKAAAAARLSASEAYDAAARDCIQIHGGIGVTWESGLHLHLRRARTLAIEQGSMTFWEDILVDRLVQENAA
jgi:alkylation response protein AidB-like acyl-CoA dehydrogenase